MTLISVMIAVLRCYFEGVIFQSQLRQIGWRWDLNYLRQNVVQRIQVLAI